MNKEEFMKLINDIPKSNNPSPIFAYESVSVEDICNAIDRLNKVPTYDELLKENEKLKEKLMIATKMEIKEIDKYTFVGIDYYVQKNQELQEENEQLRKDKKFYADACVNLKNRNDKAIEVIDTQMKLAEDGVKENLRIIKFYLIKGECSVYDLTTEEDYKYKGNNNE